jgi:hypothetical protein
MEIRNGGHDSGHTVAQRDRGLRVWPDWKRREDFVSKRILAATAAAAAMTLSLVTVSMAEGDACAAVASGFRSSGHQSGSATCSANEGSRAIAAGAYSIATAVGDSFARVTSDGDAILDAANAWYSSTAIVRNGGTASASVDSSATATNGDGNRSTLADAANGAEAEADGPGSEAYARGAGSLAIAPNGGCAEAWGGTTAVVDRPGIAVVTGRGSPVWCPRP